MPANLVEKGILMTACVDEHRLKGSVTASEQKVTVRRGYPKQIFASVNRSIVLRHSHKGKEEGAVDGGENH